MITFTVSKPLDVPLDSRGQIDTKQLWAGMWQRSPALFEADGCYVFAVPRKRGAPGLTPIYVGKTRSDFGRECFAPDKLLKLGGYLRRHPAVSLKLFLIVHPPRRGGVNGTAIIELEQRLIRMAFKANQRLINKHNAKADQWTVRGVLSNGKGKQSQPAAELCSLLGVTLHKPVPKPEPVYGVAVGMEA